MEDNMPIQPTEDEALSQNTDDSTRTGADSIAIVWEYIKKFHKIILAIPVVVIAIIIAIKSNSTLPDYVGILMLETGEYTLTVSRLTAVFGPLAVTALCLLLMFASRRTFYPWLISIFSLVLPFLFIITNIFP